MATELLIKAVAGASRDEITGWLGSRLKIRVKAPAQDGKANRAIIDVLANTLAVSKSDITIIKGHHFTHKQVAIASLNTAQLHSKLNAFLNKSLDKS